jgi:hypothetical protein
MTAVTVCALPSPDGPTDNCRRCCEFGVRAKQVAPVRRGNDPLCGSPALPHPRAGRPRFAVVSGTPSCRARSLTVHSWSGCNKTSASRSPWARNRNVGASTGRSLRINRGHQLFMRSARLATTTHIKRATTRSRRPGPPCRASTRSQRPGATNARSWAVRPVKCGLLRTAAVKINNTYGQVNGHFHAQPGTCLASLPSCPCRFDPGHPLHRQPLQSKGFRALMAVACYGCQRRVKTDPVACRHRVSF